MSGCTYLLSDQLPGTTEEDVRQMMNDFGLQQDRFDVITISSEFDPPVYKPNPQIFETALVKAGHETASEDTVFVTENLDHIEAARDLGWRAIHVPYGTTCPSGSGDCIDAIEDMLALFPPLPIDLYIRDAPGDPGDDQFTGTVFWDSPDLWIRHSEDGGTNHQAPVAGVDNWFYTRVQNRGQGIAREFHVVYAVKDWAGTEFVYPNDYIPYLALTQGESLDPGASVITHAMWPAAVVPPAGAHACWLAAVLPVESDDNPEVGAHVWEHNNLAQKNLAIVEAAPGCGLNCALTCQSTPNQESRLTSTWSGAAKTASSSGGSSYKSGSKRSVVKRRKVQVTERIRSSD